LQFKELIIPDTCYYDTRGNFSLSPLLVIYYIVALQPHECFLYVKDTSNSIILLHTFATMAVDYGKKNNAFRLKSAKGESYLLMAK